MFVKLDGDRDSLDMLADNLEVWLRRVFSTADFETAFDYGDYYVKIKALVNPRTPEIEIYNGSIKVATVEITLSIEELKKFIKEAIE